MGLEYKFLKGRGALNEVNAGARAPVVPTRAAAASMFEAIPPSVIELVPESLAREHTVIPLAFDGETITFAAADADNIALADTLRFILAKNVRLIPA